MLRTDEHKPSAIIPDDYEFVACEYLKVDGLEAAAVLQEERNRIKLHMAKTGGTYSKHVHGGNCMVCGSVNAIYTMLFYHAKTNSYIRTGSDCAAKLDMGGAHEFSAFKSKVQDALEAQAGKKKARAILEQAGLLQAWTIYLESESTEYEERTIRDIVGKLVTYGNISEKALNFVGILLNKIVNRAELKAKQEAEKAAAANCPEGRVVITGEVLSTKVQYTAFGEVVKMLVKAETGFKVWGTCPANIQRGMKIEFTATVTPSKDDPKFGFFKRPAKANVLVAAEVN